MAITTTRVSPCCLIQYNLPLFLQKWIQLPYLVGFIVYNMINIGLDLYVIS